MGQLHHGSTATTAPFRIPREYRGNRCSDHTFIVTR